MLRNLSVILLYDEKKRILLQLRDESQIAPNYWSFFGGGIEEGETPEQAVKRETMEELEYLLENPKLVFAQEFIGEHNHGTKYVFMEKYDPKKKLVQKEGKDKCWFTIDEAKALKIIGHDREVLESIKGKY
jgi:8-oxo-dGTP diphosphatase